MGNPSDLISLVVFSKPRALAFKTALQANGINASLVEVDAPDPDGLHPQHVFVSPDSLSRALKILESGDFAPVSLLKMTGMGNNLLIPVDFSPSSILAVRAGFALARKFDVEPIVMHCLDDLRFDPNRYSPRDFAKNFSKLIEVIKPQLPESQDYIKGTNTWAHHNKVAEGGNKQKILKSVRKYILSLKKQI